MTQKVRVRFAPSPTGPLHIGGVRTALYNYLFARKHGGDFLLRIEDTDQGRYVPGSEAYILDALAWCGLTFDEGPHLGGPHGPYRQSERKDIYRAYAEQLVSTGKAYYAFDSQENLENLRKEQEAQGGSFSYNWINREKLHNSLGMNPGEVRDYLKSGKDYVIRFKTPAERQITLHDLVRGEIRIDSNTLDDKVLFKSDGMPTYHLANIVDDHLMEITHVIRGEEWLPSLALHHLLYEAFDWRAPEFAHLPLIMKPTGSGKLSKRDGEKMGFPVFPLQWKELPGYRETGYFPEAVVNFLALLGWNPGTPQEVFDLDELVQAFDLDRVHKAGARFDPEKTKWYNQQHLQKKSGAELARLLRPLIESKLEELATLTGVPEPTPDLPYIESAIDLVRDRATFLSDLWEQGSYFFTAPRKYQSSAIDRHWKAGTAARLLSVAGLLDRTTDFSGTSLEATLKTWIAETEGASMGNVMAPLRLALVGELSGPHLSDIMALLGKTACITRIQDAAARIPDASA